MNENYSPRAPQAWDAIIVGGGAAGLSAAQTLGRSLRRTLVIDAAEPRNRFAAHMHNVLGHDGVEPGTLLRRGRAEAARYGVEFREASVDSVEDHDSHLTLHLESGATLETRALIAATGLTDVLPPITGLAQYWGSGVLHCPYCHGWEVRGKRLAVITTSPAGLHQARMLRQWTDDLTVFSAGLGELDDQVRRGFAARGVRLVASPVVEVIGAAIEQDAAGNTEPEAQTLLSAVRTADGALHPVDAAFVASSMQPRDAFLAGLGLEGAAGPMGDLIEVDAMHRTSHPRVWAVGNLVNPSATVPLSMGAGAFAGAAANLMLVDEDYAAAVAGTELGVR